MATPLAVELVRGGIPFVVGMAGEVADQACRLFSRLFYEALLKGGVSAALAASQGRRLGIIGKGCADPRSSVDWTLPTLFLPSAVKEVRLAKSVDEWKIRQRRLKPFACKEKYPAFCDRLEPMHWYTLLMAAGADQPALSPRKLRFQVLAIADQPSAVNTLTPSPRLGRSWVLQHFATQAVLDGHIPCLVKRRRRRRNSMACSMRSGLPGSKR